MPHFICSDPGRGGTGGGQAEPDREHHHCGGGPLEDRDPGESKYFKKLLESYALDAIDRFESKKEHKVRGGDVTAFLKGAIAAGVESRPSVALGTDCRIASDKLTGFALALDGKVLHLAMFGRNGRGNRGSGNGSRMQRASARRRDRF